MGSSDANIVSKVWFILSQNVSNVLAAALRDKVKFKLKSKSIRYQRILNTLTSILFDKSVIKNTDNHYYDVFVEQRLIFDDKITYRKKVKNRLHYNFKNMSRLIKGNINCL